LLLPSPQLAPPLWLLLLASPPVTRKNGNVDVTEVQRGAATEGNILAVPAQAATAVAGELAGYCWEQNRSC
jgi:hypothetical protein